MSPPLLGFNNNVRHNGRIFHIQTEDSGIKYPRIVTHLFADGGRIIKTARTDYSEHVGQENMAPIVRSMMKEQHKAMFIALRAGSLDDLLGDKPKAEESNSQEAEVAKPGLAPRMSTRPLSNPNLRKTTSSEAGEDKPASQPEDAGTGGREPKRSGDSRRVRSARRSKPAPEAEPRGRYAASRPAAIFGEAAPRENIFGDRVISEQSLDEVILSYLAEDLEGSQK